MSSDVVAVGTTIDRLLGDPREPPGILSRESILAADEAGEMLPGGEDLLTQLRLNDHFVPGRLGGRFDRADHTMRVVRDVFRRDGTLALGYGVTNLIASLPIWAAGSEDQQRWAADLLAGGGRIAAAYTEWDHGSDFTRIGTTARPTSDGWRLDGDKHLVNNLGRADAAVVFARTDAQPGGRSHSHFLMDLRDQPEARLRRDRRFRTAGMRGVRLAGARFDNVRLPGDAMLGEPGSAMETVLRVFQVTRIVLPGMALGMGDTQLRLVFEFAADRKLYGNNVIDIPHPRSVVAKSYAQLLGADALALVAARALHVAPEQTSVISAATKFLLPTLLQENSYELSLVLGARSYVREGEFGLFQKCTRDLPVALLAHAGGAVCLASIVPQMPGIARKSWGSVGHAPPTLFDIDGPLPGLDLGGLQITGRGRDSVWAALTLAEGMPVLGDLAGMFVAELDRIASAVRNTPLSEMTVAGTPRAFMLAERYTNVLAAAAVVGIWRYARRGDTWAAATLHRLAERSGLRPRPLPVGLEDALIDSLAARVKAGTPLDLTHDRDLP
ncbi:acyl-CoA dehydrogenase [Rhodococcus sp. IEGM 1381]|uniref:acyl-CoA dehydrogenase n=1 Tax=Rhodococcus sp. IEGM 1381 TaxID=3047085 RepID=UPI0024B7FCB3|nr:acyl-CoA dehydrogenase [Rhodococcus sp. IEGM 1381]MDI9894476.1 acyl-CoA dehydrogenase [Rhodococcus sp. IEGM 1381]